MITQCPYCQPDTAGNHDLNCPNNVRTSSAVSNVVILPDGLYQVGFIPLETLMLILGQRGIPVMIRYDCQRDKNRFTIVVGNSRLCDTDEPLKALNDYYQSVKP